MSLEDQIKKQIRHNGPMDIASFMRLAVGYYYNNRDPLGVAGDFTTAPEISQMFGELLGAWVVDCWMQMGQPERFLLVECGPGRGTLMADALRATAKVPDFHDAAQIHLIEMSESLRKKQKDMLSGYEMSWHDALDSVPEDMPLILLANEFLDALPVRQYQFAAGEWQERVIGLDDDSGLQFGLAPGESLPSSAALLPPASGGIKGGDIAEISPARQLFAMDICVRIKRQGGAALFIDYGYTEGHGDTLQAVKNHKYVPVLENIGEADLTAHVDFAALAKVADVPVFGPVTQGEFLQALGISQRAAMLKQNASSAQAEAIDSAVLKLTAEDQMGKLFKVMALANEKIKPAGF